MNQSAIKLLFIFMVTQLLHGYTFLIASASIANRPIVSRETKNNLPANLLAEAQQASLSILKPTDANRTILYQNYPDGALLFPKNPDIASKFDVMVNAIKKNPDLIEFFRKIHINSLNQLYMYLMKIYTNFNLTNPGYLAETDIPTANVSDYLINEATYATNKKKLVMNHFINLIQSQFGASIISYAPTTPADVAVTLGKIFVHNDYGIDLTPFTQPQTDVKILENQAIYITFLQKYIDFFQAYTQCLFNIDDNGINEYYSIAKEIKRFLYPTAMNTISETTTPQQTNPALAKMNPTMFFYDVESMRSIQFIPFVTKTIPAQSQLIPWAPKIVNAAVKKLTVNGHAVAFFTDNAEKTTANQIDAKHLYVLTEVGPTLFQQELLAQPGWLNTQAGSLRILRACLGDVSALVGMGILDHETEIIIKKTLALKTASVKKKS
ncbi:MAG: hypothetical protein Q8Q60_01220 [Candidatus Chromulinivorax sp.]|nr:hypothetical protein [Candidatus Chromulinivorax sp.]